jgi:predicted metalloprotease
MFVRNRTLAAAAAVLALAAIPLAGCGGDSPAASSEPAAAAADGGSDTAAVDTTSGATDPSRYANLREMLTDLGAELNTFWKDNLGDAGTWQDAVVKVVEQTGQTECGQMDAANTGPAYCEADATMVLPIAFFRDRLVGATDEGGNDAAVAAVVGHEFGHHVQALSGISKTIGDAAASEPKVANLLSVTSELGADCFMGAWLSTLRDEGRIEEGDIDEVLAALARIGDDRLTADAGQAADASTFDHGTSAQRDYWFAKGYDTGDVEACGVIYDDLLDGTLEKQLQDGADAVNSSTTP